MDFVLWILGWELFVSVFIFQSTWELSCIHTVQEGKGSGLIAQQTLAVMPVHVTQYYRAVPYLHHCSLGIPLIHSSVESRMEYKAEAFV